MYIRIPLQNEMTAEDIAKAIASHPHPIHALEEVMSGAIFEIIIKHNKRCTAADIGKDLGEIIREKYTGKDLSDLWGFACALFAALED